MKIFKSEEQRNIIVFASVIVIICLSVYIIQNVLIQRCSRIVVGVVTKKSIIFDSSDTKLTLDFQYNNQKFSAVAIDNEYAKIGDRCFLKIACEYPKHSETYWKVKVPDTLQNIPINGWGEIPYGLDKSK